MAIQSTPLKQRPTPHYLPNKNFTTSSTLKPRTPNTNNQKFYSSVSCVFLSYRIGYVCTIVKKKEKVMNPQTPKNLPKNSRYNFPGRSSSLPARQHHTPQLNSTFLLLSIRTGYKSNNVLPLLPRCRPFHICNLSRPMQLETKSQRDKENQTPLHLINPHLRPNIRPALCRLREMAAKRRSCAEREMVSGSVTSTGGHPIAV